jgi:squalene-hopene/tetraprenyl-beta-curcumene cyclase
MSTLRQHPAPAGILVTLTAWIAASVYGADKPAYQYKFEKTVVPAASADERKLDRFSPELAREYVEKGALAWTLENKCVACHTNGSYMVLRPMLAPYLGQPQNAIREFFVSQLREQLKADPSSLQYDIRPAQVVYVAAGLAAWDANIALRRSPETEQVLDLMFRLQRGNGTWISNDCWPPFESSAFQLATVAAWAAGTAPGWLASEKAMQLRAQLDRLKRYLREEPPLQGDYDRTALLWASSRLPGLLDSTATADLEAMVFSHQRPDGGWSIRTFAKPEQWGKGNRAEKLRSEPEFVNPPSDGHMTGLAIIALRGAGLPADDPRLQRGISWLLHNQRESGRWWTRSLNTDDWHFVTYSGTLYPLVALALCDALPRVSPQHPKQPSSQVPGPSRGQFTRSGIAAIQEQPRTGL